MVTTSPVGSAVALVQGAVPNGVLSVSDPRGQLTVSGRVVRVAAPLAHGDDPITVTQAAPGYRTQSWSFPMTGVSPPAGPAFVLSHYTDGTVIASDAFTRHPDVWVPAAQQDNVTPNPLANTAGRYFPMGDNHPTPAESYYDPGARTQANGEQETYADRAYPGAPVDPLAVVPGGVLDIQARPAVLARGKNYTSGLLRYSHPGLVHFCVTSRMTWKDVPGIFAAFWAYPQFGNGPAEDDQIEFNFNRDRTRVSQFKHGSAPIQNPNQVTFIGTPPTTVTGAFHDFTTCHLPSYLVTAIDGVVTSSQAVPDDWKNKRFDLLWNLAVGGPTGVVAPGQQIDMYVDGWTAWKGVDPASPPPHGVPPIVAAADLLSLGEASATILFKPDRSMEPMDGIVTAWKPTDAVDYPAGNISGVQSPGIPANVSGYPASATIDVAVAQTGPGGRGQWYEFKNLSVPAAGSRRQ